MQKEMPFSLGEKRFFMTVNGLAVFCLSLLLSLVLSVSGVTGCSDDAADDDGDAHMEAGVWDGDVMDGGFVDGTVDGSGEQDADGSDGSVEPPGCGEIVTFESGLEPSGFIHVAEDGSDAEGDGSPDSPYATIRYAADRVEPGGAVRVHPGNYEGGIYLSGMVGGEGMPIWIGGVPGEERPVIDASGNGSGIYLTEPRYVVVHDLEITGATGNGVNCDDGGDYGNDEAARYVVFRNLFIHNIGSDGNQDCLKLSGLNDFHVLDSEFTVCGGGGSGSAVDCVGCHRGLIARNNMYELSGNAVQTKGGSEDIEIRWNKFTNAGNRSLNMGGGTGFQYFRPPLSTTSPNFEARNIRAVANVFEGSYAAIAFAGCVDCVAANNTIFEPENWVFRILQETVTEGDYEFLPCSNGYIVNNLVVFRRGDISVHLNVGPNTDAESFIFETNLWYASDDPQGGSQPNLPSTENGGVVGEDPGFVNVYEIDSTSPAAGAGTPVSSLVAGDVEGECYQEPPSIGAYSVQE